MTGRAGFTLVEVVVVVLVLGIVAAVATPGLPELGHTESDAVGRAVAVLGEARRRAARRGRPVELVVEAGRYTMRLAGSEEAPERAWSESVARTPGDPRGRDGTAADAPGRVLASGRLDPSVRVVPAARTGWTAFRFRPDGRARGPRLRLRTGAGRVVALAVRPWSGRVRRIR